MDSLNWNYSLCITQIKDNLVWVIDIILKCSEIACKIRKYVVYTLSELVKKKIQIKIQRAELDCKRRIKLVYLLILNLSLYTRVNKETVFSQYKLTFLSPTYSDLDH